MSRFDGRRSSIVGIPGFKKAGSLDLRKSGIGISFKNNDNGRDLELTAVFKCVVVFKNVKSAAINVVVDVATDDDVCGMGISV